MLLKKNIQDWFQSLTKLPMESIKERKGRGEEPQNRGKTSWSIITYNQKSIWVPKPSLVILLLYQEGPRKVKNTFQRAYAEKRKLLQDQHRNSRSASSLERRSEERKMWSEEVDWVIEFLNQRDISYTSPGKKDNVHVGTFNKVRKLKQKGYLLWTIWEIFEIINGSKLLAYSEGDNFLISF